MRLLIIGSLNGQIGAASKIAISRGASVSHTPDIESALASLRSGQGADMIMTDVELDIAALVSSLVSERINVPVVGCGIGNDPSDAVRAIKAGAKEYIPLPPDAELIAAVLQAVTEEKYANHLSRSENVGCSRSGASGSPERSEHIGHRRVGHR